MDGIFLWVQRVDAMAAEGVLFFWMEIDGLCLARFGGPEAEVAAFYVHRQKVTSQCFFLVFLLSLLDVLF